MHWLVAAWSAPGVIWLCARLASVATGGLAGVVGAWPQAGTEPGFDLVSCLVILVFCPIALLLVVGLQATNSASAPRWRKPSWHVNPFLMREPLQLFHLAAFQILAAGFAALLVLLLSNAPVTQTASLLASAGAGLWIGVRLRSSEAR